nr:MAG TPA: hypothetical protein [Caudoviricetes sp.]
MNYMVKVILVSVFVLSAFCMTCSMVYLITFKQEDHRSTVALVSGALVSSVAFYSTLFLLAYLP